MAPIRRFWAEKGQRPKVRQFLGYKSMYYYGAVNPESGDSLGLITPNCNRAWTQLHLEALSEHIGEEKHAIVYMDRASWHTTKKLDVPGNITLYFFPAYSPELNGIENLWNLLKSRYLANRIFRTLEEVIESMIYAWLSLTPEQIRSTCHCKWLAKNNQ